MELSGRDDCRRLPARVLILAPVHVLLALVLVARSGLSGSPSAEMAAEAPHPDNLLSVSSVDAQDRKSTFSPYHPLRVEISAPGEYGYGPAPGGRMAAWSGTSMAAPMVSGALALALAAVEAGWEARVPAASFPSALLQVADEIDHLNEGYYRGRAR